MNRPDQPEPPSDRTDTPVNDAKRAHEMACYRIKINMKYVLMYIEDLDINDRRKASMRLMASGVREAIKGM